MEPLTITLLMFFVLLSGGTTRQVYKRTKKRQKEELREVLLEKFPAPDRYISLFDIFWDLGVSDFALVIMGHQDLLPRGKADREALFRQIDDRIEAHGSYEAFISDVLEAIQEFYQDHRRAGQRRALPTLSLPAVKLLPMPSGSADGASTALAARSAVPPSSPEDGLPDGYLLDLEFEERTRIRENRSAADSALVPTGASQVVDIDELLAAGPLDILKGVLQGNFADRLGRWIQLRQLRQLRSELDEKLGALYLMFDSMARRDPDFFAPLYDLTRRWEREAMRIEHLEKQRPWADRPYAQASDLLMEEARIFARYLARHARQNTDEALQSIQRSAQRGDRAMAGYLVYANRFAFFAGRGDHHARLVSEIEYTASRIQGEIRELRQRDVV
jgi:hypothetical protein